MCIWHSPWRIFCSSSSSKLRYGMVFFTQNIFCELCNTDVSVFRLSSWSLKPTLSSVEENFQKTKTTKQGKIHQQKGVRPPAVSWFELDRYSTLPGAPMPKTFFEEQSLKRLLFFNLLNSDECPFEVTTRRNFRKICYLIGQREPKQSTGFSVIW